MRRSKIYHIALIVCAPYFVNLNNNTFQLFIYVHSKRDQKKSSPVIKFTVLQFRHCYFESSNHKQCPKCPPSASTQADRRRLHSSMAWFTTDWSSSHHTEIRRSRSSWTSLTLLWYTRCIPCFVHFSGFGSAKII